MHLAGWFRDRCPVDVDAVTATSVPQVVDAILRSARELGASDVHLRPTGDGTEMRFRVDGVLQTVTRFPEAVSPNLVSRLKVLAGLLTYRLDVPQEGRIESAGAGEETRVSVFPTLFGEKVVVRLFAASGHYERVDDLGLPDDVGTTLRRKLHETSGVVLLTGPAGCGKTTTIYAAVRDIVRESAGSRSVVTIEDPIECVVPDVDQTSIRPQAGMDLLSGLRSIVRQDPDVIMVGEIRDRETAELVFQASLIGNLVLTTYHAGSCARAIGRLHDMGIEPYLIRSGLAIVFCQRLLRKLCDCKAVETAPSRWLPVDVTEHATPVGCARCRGTGYRGRVVVSEMLEPDDPEVGRAILARADVDTLEGVAAASGAVGLADRCLDLVRRHVTSLEEVVRVLGSLDRVTSPIPEPDPVL